MIRVPHFHFATGHKSANRGKYYLCGGRKAEIKTVFGCCLMPAYQDAEGTIEMQS